MGIRGFIVIIICSFAFMSAGCELYYRRPIEISLPACPLAAQWLVEYPEKTKNGKTFFTVETLTLDRNEAGASMHISIARGINLPVLARPVFSGITGGFPAGAVYPVDVKDGCLTLYWEDGFACEILKACLLNSDAVTAFDTVRFRESLLQKTEELIDSEGLMLPGGCWLFDPVSIKSRLGYGFFRESSIKAAPRMSFRIPVTGRTYVSDNPFYPELSSDDSSSGMFINVLIPINRKTVFFDPLSGEIVEAFFDDSRWCWMNLLTQASEFGRM